MTEQTETENHQGPWLSLVIPAYNEAQRLAKFLPPALDWLQQQPFTFEVIIVDDGSADNTGQVARELDANGVVRVLRQEPNQGKGAAIRRGMLEAAGQVILFSDADFSSPITEATKLTRAIEQGAAVAFGSRALPDSSLEMRQPWFREMTGRAFNLIVRLLLLPGVQDTQCGFKAFTQDAARAIFSRQKLDGFAFDVEVLILARGLGFTIQEIPVRWINDPASKVSMLRGLQGFVDLVRLRLSMGQLNRPPKQ
jgi:dolichyl-phosphate beta-glucosyltransferase